MRRDIGNEYYSYEVSFEGDENVLKLDYGDGCRVP